MGLGVLGTPETNFVVRDCCGRYTSRLSDCYSATSNSSPVSRAGLRQGLYTARHDWQTTPYRFLCERSREEDTDTYSTTGYQFGGKRRKKGRDTRGIGGTGLGIRTEERLLLTRRSIHCEVSGKSEAPGAPGGRPRPNLYSFLVITAIS